MSRRFKFCKTSVLLNTVLFNLGNPFVAVGSTELSNKMVSHTTDQKVSPKPFTSSGSCVTVERQYGRGFSVNVAPTRDTCTGLLNSLHNRKRGR
jgi:hypothetical protein